MSYWDAENKVLIEGPPVKVQKKLRTAMRRAKAPIPVQRSVGEQGEKAAEMDLLAKQAFLDDMAETNNITHACAVGYISYTLYRSWRNSGFITDHEMNEALRRFRDKIRLQLIRLGLDGVQKLVVTNGKVAVDKRGKEIVIKEIDGKILMEFARRYLEEFKDEPKPDTTINIDISGIPQQYLLAIDARELLPDEIEIIKQVGRNIELRKQQQALAIETTIVQS